MLEDLWNAIAPDGTTAALVALAGIAWRLIAGKKADDYRARVKEIARAAWQLAKAIDSDGDTLTRARRHAKELLANLKIPDQAIAWLEYEFTLLIADDAAEAKKQGDMLALVAQQLQAMRVATSTELEDEWDDAEERGRARIDADVPPAIILCPEPMCSRRKGHAGQHGRWSVDDELPTTSGEFETKTEAR